MYRPYCTDLAGRVQAVLCPFFFSYSAFSSSPTSTCACRRIALSVPTFKLRCKGTVTGISPSGVDRRRLTWLPVWRAVVKPKRPSARTTSQPDNPRGSLAIEPELYNHRRFGGRGEIKEKDASSLGQISQSFIGGLSLPYGADLGTFGDISSIFIFDDQSREELAMGSLLGLSLGLKLGRHGYLSLEIKAQNGQHDRYPTTDHDAHQLAVVPLHSGFPGLSDLSWHLLIGIRFVVKEVPRLGIQNFAELIDGSTTDVLPAPFDKTVQADVVQIAQLGQLDLGFNPPPFHQCLKTGFPYSHSHAPFSSYYNKPNWRTCQLKKLTNMANCFLIYEPLRLIFIYVINNRAARITSREEVDTEPLNPNRSSDMNLPPSAPSSKSKAILAETSRLMADRRARSAQQLADHKTLRASRKAASREIVEDAKERGLARLNRSRRERIGVTEMHQQIGRAA